MRLHIAALAALLVTSMPAVAQTTAGFTLREWSRLDEHDRQVAMVAAVEGIMLASAAPGAAGVDTECLVKISLPKMDTDMRQAVAGGRDGDFLAVMLEESKCSRS